MVTAVGEIIIDKIKNLPFVDKYAGVVKTLQYNSQEEGGKLVKKMYPVACNTTPEQCAQGRYKDLCPDSSKKSVLYLEDKGARFIKKEAALLYWRASYDLVCWLNLPKIGADGCSYSAIAINSIIASLPAVPQNIDIYKQLLIVPTGQAPKNQNPFQKYSYDETITQHLMYPYDYFVLGIDVEFNIDKRCLTVAPINSSVNCIKG